MSLCLDTNEVVRFVGGYRSRYMDWIYECDIKICILQNLDMFCKNLAALGGGIITWT
jgi:hypothetical protein